MAGIDLATAEAKLAEWLAASTAVANNQSYTIGGRQLTRANAKEVREMIEYWDSKVNTLARKSGTRRSVRYGVKSDD